MRRDGMGWNTLIIRIQAFMEKYDFQKLFDTQSFKYPTCDYLQ